jgi:predicted phage gp36 major capsid-like protein
VRDNVTKPGYIRYIMFKRVGGIVKDSNAIKLLKVASS